MGDDQENVRYTYGTTNSDTDLANHGGRDVWSQIDPKTIQGLGGPSGKDTYDGFCKGLVEQVNKSVEDKHQEAASEKAKEKADKEKEGAKELAKQSYTVSKMLFSKEKPSDEERQETLLNALVGLVGALMGEKYKGSELPERIKTLWDIKKGKLSDKEKKEKMKEGIKDLSKLIAKGGDDLAEQIMILVDLMWGDPTPEEREKIFMASVKGLVKRLGYGGLLNSPYVRAATAGYKFAAPFGEKM